MQGRLPTCYSPVRHSSTPKGLSVRLACVKHAASVRPEPGSNSPNKDSPSQSSRRIPNQRNLTTNTKHQNWHLEKNNHTQHTGSVRHDKKQQQNNSPNTLLSSQTTPAPQIWGNPASLQQPRQDCQTPTRTITSGSFRRTGVQR